MNRFIFSALIIMRLTVTYAGAWVYQSDDFSIKNGCVTEFRPQPGIQRGLITSGGTIHADILETSLLRDGNTTWFLSDDELICFTGTNQYELLLPCMTEQMKADYRITPDIHIIADTASLRAVAENRQYILAADFRAPGTAGYLSAETPAVVSTRHRIGNLDIAVSPVSAEQSVIVLAIHPVTEPFMDTAKLRQFTARGISELLTSHPHLTDIENRVTFHKAEGKLFIQINTEGLYGHSYRFSLDSKF